ncbi:hypothetical protein LMG29542_00661 [Paraburkholderia humisilvae]|uniref:Transmembrane protein n=2 Tax=Paraburkholderia humisilvae TaxID=627669 RepID=A0A6J5D5F6_9BURK|nr:hypothetical protein LMG29542_00661 [Paraburkholderia humisilvae]
MIKRLTSCVISIVVIMFLAIGACGESYAGDAASDAAPATAASAPAPVYVKVPASTIVAMLNYSVDKDGMVTLSADQLPNMVTQAHYSDRKGEISVLILGSIAFGILSIAIIAWLAYLIRAIFWIEAAKDKSAKWRKYLMQLPLGAPEGSVRALITLFIVVFGLIVLALQNYLGLDNANAIAGFVGSVIAFYFAARNSDQVQKAVELAHDASKDTTTTVAAAIHTATTAAVSAQQDATEKASTASAAAVNNAASATQGVLKVVSSQLAPASTDTTGGAAQPAADLQNLSDQLTAMQTVAHAASTLNIGADVLPNAASTLTTLNNLVAKIQPLTTGNPDPASVQDAITTVTQQLPALQSAGLPGALGSALAVFRRLAGPAATIVAGLPGGPVGLIAGVITAGIQLANDRQRYAPVKTALLNKPFDPAFMPSAVDAALAKCALSGAPLMLEHYSPLDDDTATGLLTFALQKKEQGSGSLSPGDLASKAWSFVSRAAQPAAGQPAFPSPKVAFASLADVTAAFDEYLASVVFQCAIAHVGAALPLPSVPGIPQGATIDLQQLANAARAILPDPKASAELERLVYIAEALGGLPTHPDQIASIAAGALNASLTVPVVATPDEAPQNANPQP